MMMASHRGLEARHSSDPGTLLLSFYYQNHDPAKLHMRMIRRLSNISAIKQQKTKCFSMAWYCSGSTNNELVENLVKVDLIKNERVKEAMLGVSSCTRSPSIPPAWLTPVQG